MPTTEASVAPSGTGRRPREDEIDACGVTHPGKVRRDNQDHYLLCSLRREVVVRGSSIPQADAVLGNESERLASMAMVADGVGGAAKGETASRVALTGIARYVSRSLRCYYRSEEAEDFSEALRQGARECHEELRRLADEQSDHRGMATTLTLYLGVWPRAYLLQVGDSRCYLLRDGELSQITRDQTMAQEMVDLGIMKPDQVAGTRLEHTLTSSIGGSSTQPTVTRFDMNWGHVLLLCSDGLTRHVPDDRIREVLRSMTSAQQGCETLLKDALDGGGSDNITVVIGRAVKRH
ncbi:MAG TPA: protein phosphatase 2C domain-containing protein [Gemmatimonadales bacterium]|nr:protein phosphatase 2C domain-containing protein [Gemmatimonadales bacterium]